MNTHIDAQCKNMIAIVKTFEHSCEMAAIQDDGKISRDEEKILRKIKASTQKFMLELSRI
ncbi:hypothetical protein SDC9_73072 [bioreactor metagenome]|uniref:Uncharacterized protein n=1 Tax=bioreactor metagenome TaxID=1076179 RepID=A0A644YF13_9ZZZZ